MALNSDKVVFVSGNFNILHPGHLRLIRFAKELGGRLVVGVYSDNIAGKNALVPQTLRMEALQSNSWIDEVILVDSSIEKLIGQLKPNIVVKGKEHEHLFNAEQEVLETYGGKLVFSSGETVFSSFDLIQRELHQKKSLFDLPQDYMKRHNVTASQMVARINAFKNLKVIVIGDLIVDEYITCESLGMSQEDPTIVVTPIESTKFIGGSGIVAAHASSLGAQVSYFSITGKDKVREFAIDKLKEFSVQSYLFEDDSRPTTLKQRFRCKGKTMLRVSHLHQGTISADLQSQLFTQVEKLLHNCDLLIFSDFNYGCLPTELVNEIIEVANKLGILMVADSQSSSQSGDIARFKNMSLITPTEREARLSVRDSENGLVVLAEKLRTQALAKNIFLKIGEEGILIHAETDEKERWLTDRIPALNKSPVDVAGAGDSMLVVGAMAMACGAGIWETAVLGSIAAGIQVSRVGNIPMVSSELLAQF